MATKKLFDDWPERYDQWFTTPIGRLIKEFEGGLVNELLSPAPDEKILDAGCGTGIFTRDLLSAGARVVGLELSSPMLHQARKKAGGDPFQGVQGDMLNLPFYDNTFDKTVSITALEFIKDAPKAVNELFRVTRQGGLVVVATLNRLSPWAGRRKAKTQRGQKHILENAHFRSPRELLSYGPSGGNAKTAVYFEKEDPPDEAVEKELRGRSQNLDTGAFVAACWQKNGRGTDH
ncbi:MAG: class I SAM-dependent methyltransferase [Desulfobacterales bacterium]|nr:class I SAM-dependent methyltransferase [Desulfobacterales bacterium]